MSHYEMELDLDADHSAKEPFLPATEISIPCDRSRIRKLQTLVYTLALTTLLLSIICLTLLWAPKAQSSTPKKGHVYCKSGLGMVTGLELYTHMLPAPAEHLIRNKYVEVVFSSGFGMERTEYQGPPSPERNALWDDLYGCK